MRSPKVSRASSMGGMSKHWFSSDWHLGHTNILKYDPRPFDDIIWHDETIISNFNSLVSANDNVYFLGDFCLNSKKTEEYLERLNGKLNFIKGNHDHNNTIKLYEKYGNYLGQLADLTVGNQRIVLCHYRLEVWNRSHYGSWCLHGHSHHALHRKQNCLDLGVNGHDYKPLEFKDIKKAIKEHNDRLKSDKDFYLSRYGGA